MRLLSLIVVVIAVSACGAPTSLPHNDRQPDIELRSLANVNKTFGDCRLESIDLEVSAAVDAELETSLERTKLMLLGEVHGVAENPALILALIKRYRFRCLGLEWPASLQPLIDRFHKTGKVSLEGLDTFSKDLFWGGDGRITAGHFALLRYLREERMIDKLILYSAPGVLDDWSFRDRGMAKNILARRNPSVRLLVVAGNLHTPLQDTANGTPMGANIARAVPGVREVRIDYLSGFYYNFGVRAFHGRPSIIQRRGSRVALLAERNGEILLEIENVRAATVPRR